MRDGQPRTSGPAEIEPADRLAAAASRGHSIRDDVRRQLESGTGAALDDVRVHTDAGADTLADRFGARAFTTGRHIYFAAGTYRPESSDGYRLLAHEVVHTVQGGSPAGGIGRARDVVVSHPGDAGEQAAESIARQLLRMRDGPVRATPPHAPAVVPHSSSLVARFPTDAGVADAGGADAGAVTIGDHSVPTDPVVQRRQMEQLLQKRGRKGPRDYLSDVEIALLPDVPIAGPIEDPEVARAATAMESLRQVVAALESDSARLVTAFTGDGRTVLNEILKDSETRAKAEGIKYGLTEETLEELVTVDPMSGLTGTVTSTKYDMPGSPAAKGLAAAAAQLLKRRTERIAPLKGSITELRTRWAASFPPGGGTYQPPKPPGLEEAENKLKIEEQEYDGLAAELAGRYPILGSFTTDKDDTGELERLAAGPSQDAAQLIGTQIASTLGKIKQVRAQNTPDGDVNIYKLGTVVALTKARQSIADGTWQAKVIAEEVAEATESNIFIDIALALLNLALVALAPATGGATLIVAAGLSTATAVVHAQEYMLEDALAGSDVDKARALSQEEPSLFWLALDIVGAVGDVGAGATAAAKLLGVWKSALPAVRAAKAAKTAEELAAARAQLSAALESQPALLTRVTRSLEEEGRLGRVTKEVEAVEKAADVAQAELKAGRQAATDAGHVHVTKSGRVFSCASPCTEMRARYSEILASDEGKGMLDTLTAIEQDAAKLTPGDDAGLAALAKRAATLDNDLAMVAVRARAQKIAAWLPTMGEAYPALKDNPLGTDAIVRIIGKKNVDHMKGQLLEELAGVKIQKMITAGDKAGLEKLAGDRAGAALEYIGGHSITDARGKQFTDGMLIIRDGDKMEIVAILESKAGKAASRGLGSEYTSLKPDGSYKSLKELGPRNVSEATDDLIEARLVAIEEVKQANPKAYGKLSMKQIDEAPEAQAQITGVLDKMVKTESGQATQDIERAVSLGLKIDGKDVQVAKAGRGSTKVVGVLPTDVNAAAIEAKIGGKGPKGQGLNFGTTDVGMSAKELNDLATEISTRATAPTL